MTGAEPHPPEHILAELADQGRDGTDRSELLAHVRSCESCQAVVQRLNEVERVLHALPARLPTPDHVSARIGSALAAEAPAAEHADHREHAPARLRRGPLEWFRQRTPRILAAAAAAAIVAIAGYSVVAGDGSPMDFATSGGDDAAESADESSATMSEGGGVSAPQQDGAEQEEADEESAAGERMTEGGPLGAIAMDVWFARSEVEPRCGQPLAEEQGLELVGSSEVGEDILIVLTDNATLSGWTVPDCETVPPGGEPDVVVPVPDE